MEKERIIKSFVDELIRDVHELKGGHINRSYLVTGQEQYVLQCLNIKLYNECLEIMADNYSRYKKACIESERDIGKWICPEWIKDRNSGDYFHKGPDGNIWRMYRYIRSDISFFKPYQYNTFAVGAGLGKLHRILKRCDGIRACNVNRRIYDLSFHFRKYKDQRDSEMERVEKLDHIISVNIDKMLDVFAPAESVIHGDAKTGNMIFHDGEIAGFIDLDTIMPGSVYNDMADCVRSCCIDETGKPDPQKLVLFCRGYEKGSDTELTDHETELLVKMTDRNRFMEQIADATVAEEIANTFEGFLLIDVVIELHEIPLNPIQPTCLRMLTDVSFHTLGCEVHTLTRDTGIRIIVIESLHYRVGHIHQRVMNDVVRIIWELRQTANLTTGTQLITDRRFAGVIGSRLQSIVYLLNELIRTAVEDTNTLMIVLWRSLALTRLFLTDTNVIHVVNHTETNLSVLTSQPGFTLIGQFCHTICLPTQI